MKEHLQNTLDPREIFDFGNHKVKEWFTGVLGYYIHNRLQKTLKHMHDGGCTFNSVPKEIAHSLFHDAGVYKEESINGRKVPSNIMEMFSFLSPFPTPVLIDILLKTDFDTVANFINAFLENNYHTEEEN